MKNTYKNKVFIIRQILELQKEMGWLQSRVSDLIRDNSVEDLQHLLNGTKEYYNKHHKDTVKCYDCDSFVNKSDIIICSMCGCPICKNCSTKINGKISCNSTSCLSSKN